MRERIEQLEANNQVMPEVDSVTTEVITNLKQKINIASKKLKEKDYELQTLKSEVLAAKDNFAKVQLEIMASE
jgi:uncharacterized coiled-coil DUF342 family protein